MATLPTNIPQLSDITSIVVGELGCDGIEGNVLKVIGFLVQLDTLEKRLEQRAVKQFADEAQDSFQAFLNQFTEQTQAAWEDALNDFEKWLADAEQGNILGGLSQGFGPLSFLEASNPTDFAIFDYNSTIGNILDPGGTAKDLSGGTGCGTGMGFSLGSSQTTSFSATLSPKLNVAGQVASFGAQLVSQAELFMQGLAETANSLNTVISGNEEIFNSMLSNANDIVAELNRLTDSDYSLDTELVEFGQLLDTAIRDLKTAERRFASGDAESEQARQSLQEAVNWICFATDSVTRLPIYSKVTSLVALMQAQVDLFRSSDGRTVQLSANISAHQDNLRTETKFQPTFANFFTKVRCGLEKIQEELSSINRQNSVLFQVKKLEWCAVMTSYRVLLDQYNPEVFQTDLEAQFETDLGVNLNELGISLSTLDTEDQANAVISAAQKFIERSVLKLRQNFDISIVSSAKTELENAIDAYREQTEEIKEAIEDFLNKAGVDEAREAAQAFFTAAQAVSALAPLVSAMADGEYNAMFTLDGLNSQLSEVVAQVISRAVECCEENGAGDAQSRTGLVELRAAQQQANDEARLASFDAHFGAAEVVPNSSVRILFDLRALKQQYTKFKRLMQIPCLGNIGSTAKII